MTSWPQPPPRRCRRRNCKTRTRLRQYYNAGRAVGAYCKKHGGVRTDLVARYES